jgi:dTDP-glucose 4,6-dehydratase
LSNKHLFITGGTGFFGKWLLEAIQAANLHLQANIKVTILSRDADKFKRQFPRLSHGIQFIQGDILTVEFPRAHYDYLIHAATEASATLNKENPTLMLQTIVSGMERVLNFARSNRIAKTLFTSSGAVYGPQPTNMDFISEDYSGAPDPTSSLSAYGEGKRVAELMGCLYARETGLHFTIARCFAFSGPYLPLDGTYAIGNFVADIQAGREIRMTGDGSPRRSYLYGADLAIWLLTILECGQSGQAYNVGSDDWITIKDLAAMVKSNKSKTNDTRKDSAPNSQASRYVPSIQKAKTQLGLVPWTNLALSIENMLGKNQS